MREGGWDLAPYFSFVRAGGLGSAQYKVRSAEAAISNPEYLLNSAHRSGASKARFLGEFGFELAAWETLAQALREHSQRKEVSKVTETPFGPRYEIIGELYAPDGRAPIVCTIWQMDHGKVAPRLVAAYPFRRQEN